MTKAEQYSLNDYRTRAKRIARQLYSPKVVLAIADAKSEAEISRILITARQQLPDL